MTLCIIPARGGSKGVSHKNVVHLGGKPLLVWSVEQALAARMVSRVIVTTDDDVIAMAADVAGAEVFSRSPETATDDATTESALLEVISSLPEHERPELCVLLQATSPIRQPHDIDHCIATLVREGCDSVFSARAVEGYTWSRSSHGTIANYKRRQRRQEQTSHTVEENGSIYVFRTEPFLHTQNRLFGAIGHYLMHPLDSYQLDTPDDFPILEQLIRMRLTDACCVTT